MYDLFHPSARRGGVVVEIREQSRKIFVNEASKWSFFLCFQTMVLEVSAKLNSNSS